MAQITVVYWRDIPAQVIVKVGRKSAKRELSQRFQEAIDMAAMRAKAIGTDAYLEDWRRDAAGTTDGDMEAEAQAWQDKLEAQYDDAAVEALVANKGYAEAQD